MSLTRNAYQGQPFTGITSIENVFAGSGDDTLIGNGGTNVLVGNAGVLGFLSPLDHVEPKVWDEVMAVNLKANWHLIRFMDPLLRKSDAGRAVPCGRRVVWSGGSRSPRATRPGSVPPLRARATSARPCSVATDRSRRSSQRL